MEAVESVQVWGLHESLNEKKKKEEEEVFQELIWFD